MKAKRIVRAEDGLRCRDIVVIHCPDYIALDRQGHIFKLLCVI